MSKRNALHQLPWGLIVLLVSLALLWPLSKAMGLTDALPPIIIGSVWVGIRILWLVIVVAKRVTQPFWTLVAAGVAYELVAVVFQQINWSGADAARLPAVIATLIMGLITGSLLGGVAVLIMRRNKR